MPQRSGDLWTNMGGLTGTGHTLELFETRILKALNAEVRYSALWFLQLATLLVVGCSQQHAESPFAMNESTRGILLLENDVPVFFYQREPKISFDTYAFNNYLHPLYDLKGETLTEEFPEDHPHHRGIFWAWHQIYVDDVRIGDGWMMENIAFDVRAMKTSLDDKTASLTLHVLWSSSAFQLGKPFLEENTAITVHRTQSGIRSIDFEISLKPLVSGVQLGGSEEVEKGYGGFCARIKLPEGLAFTSEGGPVTPLEGQVMAGPWMDFSSGQDTTNDTRKGLAILCHSSTPNYPAPWILRQEGSMQNIVFPGSQRIALQPTQPVVLRYRLIVYDGTGKSTDVAALQREYEAVSPLIQR